MYIETERLILRDFRSDDGGDLYEILGDAETMKNCEPAYDFEKTRKFLEEFCVVKKGAAAAVLKDSQKLIGYILFKPWEEAVYEIGWIFNKRYWRQGYAYEACSALIEYGFRELKLHKVVAETIDGQKSVGLMEKLGMKREGVQKGQVKDACGNRADLYFYGLPRNLQGNQKMELCNLSTQYLVRRLNNGDIEAVYNLSRGNPLFYRYHPPFVTRESILEDMRVLPPGKGYDDKFYIGFFRNDKLTAVMDHIRDYPGDNVIFVGFFMVDAVCQGQGIGTEIIEACCAYWKGLGYRTVRLGVDKGNPQSSAFWRKNRFEVTGERSNGPCDYVMMERTL